MLQNYLAAALRNLWRNGSYAAINILGLALGFATVIVIALYVRDEYSYDRFVPGSTRVYRVMETVDLPGEAPLRVAVTASHIAAAMTIDFPEVEATTRLTFSKSALRHGDIDTAIDVGWVDPSFFQLFPLRVVAGDPNRALSTPDGLVLTRSAARRFFGSDAVVGRRLELDRKYPMQVGAVIEDLPANTHLAGEVFATGIASFSRLTRLDSAPTDPVVLRPEDVYTYVRLRPGADIGRLRAAMTSFATRHVTGQFGE